MEGMREGWKERGGSEGNKEGVGEVGDAKNEGWELKRKGWEA